MLLMLVGIIGTLFEAPKLVQGSLFDYEFSQDICSVQRTVVLFCFSCYFVPDEF